MDLINKIINHNLVKSFFSGHKRSIKVKKNVLTSLLIKGLSIGISLVLLPMTINYVNPSRYGIWLTLSSIVAWFSFFDIGLTQGLRNKFAEAKARGDHYLAQVYVSTTYALLGIIFLGIWVLFLISNNFLNWASILNVSENMRSEVSLLAVIVFTYFCLSFVLKIITTILIADQQPAKSSVLDLSGHILSLIFVFFLVQTTEGSLIRLGIALCLSPIIVLIGANIIFFKGIFKDYRPSISKVNFSYARRLLNLGVIFFVIQVAGVLQYQTANIIIARHFGTTDVTSYNIVHKYFGTLNMIFVIFLTPFWSASTEAYVKKEIQWIKNGIRKYNQLNIVIVIISTLMLIFSNTIYDLWLGKGKVDISLTLSFYGFLFFNASIFGSKYVYFLNSINALRLQFWASLFSPVLYFAVAIALIKYFNTGLHALYIASLLANFNGFIIAPLQYYQVIYRNKKGLWIR